MSILSFRSKDAEMLFRGERPPRFRNIAAVAERKLQQLDNAASLEFLRSPPGNRLEQLKADPVGQYSIRINDQFRICFRWTAAGPADVDIVDYH